MPDLVTLDEAKDKLRIFHDDFDVELLMLISAASLAVVNYLDTRAETVLDLDSGGDVPSVTDVPAEIKAATLYLVDVLHRGDGDAFEMGYLPKPVTALLYPLKDPTLA